MHAYDRHIYVLVCRNITHDSNGHKVHYNGKSYKFLNVCIVKIIGHYLIIRSAIYHPSVPETNTSPVLGDGYSHVSDIKMFNSNLFSGVLVFARYEYLAVLVKCIFT